MFLLTFKILKLLTIKFFLKHKLLLCTLFKRKQIKRFRIQSFYFKFYLRNKKQGRCGVSRHQSHSHHTGLFALLRVLECIRIPEHKGKKWSTFSLVLWVLFFLTLILILLLALGIVYLPTTDDDFPTTDLSAFRRKTSQRCYYINSL